jgi:hypothetical protein
MGLLGRIFGGDKGPTDPPALRQEIEKAVGHHGSLFWNCVAVLLILHRAV